MEYLEIFLISMCYLHGGIVDECNQNFEYILSSRPLSPCLLEGGGGVYVHNFIMVISIL